MYTCIAIYITYLLSLIMMAILFVSYDYHSLQEIKVTILKRPNA